MCYLWWAKMDVEDGLIRSAHCGQTVKSFSRRGNWRRVAMLRHFCIRMRGTCSKIWNVPSLICVYANTYLYGYRYVWVFVWFVGCSMLIGTTAKNLHFTALGAGFQRLLSQLSQLVQLPLYDDKLLLCPVWRLVRLSKVRSLEPGASGIQRNWQTVWEPNIPIAHICVPSAGSTLIYSGDDIFCRRHVYFNGPQKLIIN